MAPDRLSALELRRLVRDNEADLEVLRNLAGEVASVAARAWPLGDETCAFLALRLHAWYTALESLLERVARVVEGAVPTGPSSHRDLLRGMTLPLEGIRPRVLDPGRLEDLMALLGFRHFVRHAYAVTLDEGELRVHASRVGRLQPGVEADLQGFAAAVRQWIADLERSG